MNNPIYICNKCKKKVVGRLLDLVEWYKTENIWGYSFELYKCKFCGEKEVYVDSSIGGQELIKIDLKYEKE